jgi:transcriptional regulator with XRE-family HTH domain
MDLKQGFARALKQARKRKGLSQESFSDVSSRTYVSTLERGLYTPTLDKITSLSQVIGIHPLTLITMAYLEADKRANLEELLDIVRREI